LLVGKVGYMMLSSKAYTGVIKAYGQAAMYAEALVMFNTINEMGSKPTIETYDLHVC
jgi:pentatricopeptide repeat protein